MASINYHIQRIGKSSCIRCEFETNEKMSFAEQDAAMMAHLAEKHPDWMTEPLTRQQEQRLAKLHLTPDQRRIAELEQQLAALSWARITPETKFDRSLDYLLGRPLRGCSVIRGDDFQRDGAGAHLKRVGWTHFRPINPPPPSGAKGETKP